MEPEDDVLDDDTDQNNPADCSAEVWSEIYADPDYNMDHDHSMDF